MRFGFYHFHKRLRAHRERAEEESHFSLKKFILDEIVYVAAIMSPIMTIPQVIIIFQNKTAAGVSIHSWVSYFLIACVWLYYGYVHNEKPIIITNAGWMILSLCIIGGIIIYS